MAWVTRAALSSLGKKYIMAATGLLLGCFLLVHAAGNATIIWGRGTFLSYAAHLHALGFLVAAVEPILLVVFLTHVTTGVVIFTGNLTARPERYAVHSRAGGRTWGSATMPYTGVLVLGFILMHLINFRLQAQNANIADLVSGVLSRPPYTVLYAIGLCALALHVSHGFWSLLQSTGINHPKYDRFLRNCAWLACGLIAAVFLFIVLLLAVNGKQLA